MANPLSSCFPGYNILKVSTSDSMLVQAQDLGPLGRYLGGGDMRPSYSVCCTLSSTLHELYSARMSSVEGL